MKPNRSHDELQQLLDERKRYEAWMATLESRRESTPEHVYKRVHADYDHRLASVRDKLTERTGEIRSAISGLKDRLKQTTEQETERVDELHEAELRAAVGEFTPEQWALRKREVEVDLKRFVDEKKKISDELNQLLLIIEQTTDHGEQDAETPKPTPSPPKDDAGGRAPPATAAPVPIFTPAEEKPAVQPAPVAAEPTRARGKTPARSRPAMQPAPATPAAEEKPPVPIESLAPAAVSPPAAESVPTAPSSPTTDSGAAAPATDKPDSKSAGQSRRGKSSSFAPATADPRRENEKTLKCGECGAMNYPTEWYCESCGAELSAL